MLTYLIKIVIPLGVGDDMSHSITHVLCYDPKESHVMFTLKCNTIECKYFTKWHKILAVENFDEFDELILTCFISRIYTARMEHSILIMQGIRHFFTSHRPALTPGF